MGEKLKIREKEFDIKKFTVEQVANLLPLLSELQIPEKLTGQSVAPFALKNLSTIAEIFSSLYGEKPQWYKDLDVFELIEIVTAVCSANLDALKNFNGTLEVMAELQEKIIEVTSAFGSASQSSSNLGTQES